MSPIELNRMISIFLGVTISWRKYNVFNGGANLHILNKHYRHDWIIFSLSVHSSAIGLPKFLESRQFFLHFDLVSSSSSIFGKNFFV